MRLYLFSFALASTCMFTDLRLTSIAPSFGECCGRCTGSAYCTACKNCSRCAYCNSGGTCGVCSDGTPRSYQTSHSTSRSTPAENTDNRSPVRSTPVENLYSRFVTSSSSPKPKETSPTQKKSASISSPTIQTMAWVNSDVLNIRKGPGTEYEILGKLYKDDLVEILEPVYGKWVLIEAEKVDYPTSVIIKGYVYAAYLRR